MQGAVASAAALAATWKPREVRADVSGSVNVYTSSGLRWEGSMRAALPLFEQVYPNIDVNFVAEPIGETFPKINVMMESQIDTFNVIYTDYGQWPSMYVKEALTPLQPFADQDPAWFEDYLNDVPREISKLYRVPPEQDGELYGLTPDGNALLATYRKDVLDKHGISYPETFDEWIEAAKEVHDPDNEVYAYCASLQRGAWFGFNFWAALAAHGGSWFDRMEKGYWNPTFNTEAGYLALKAMKELQAYAHRGHQQRDRGRSEPGVRERQRHPRSEHLGYRGPEQTGVQQIPGGVPLGCSAARQQSGGCPQGSDWRARPVHPAVERRPPGGVGVDQVDQLRRHDRSAHRPGHGGSGRSAIARIASQQVRRSAELLQGIGEGDPGCNALSHAGAGSHPAGLGIR